MTQYRQPKDVTAVILAGGLGTRLSSVVSDRPKALAQVNDRPFLGFLLQQLSVNFSSAVLCTGHLGDQIESAFGSCTHGMRLSYSREPAPLGTGGALRLALPLLETELAFVLNGDSFCTLDYPAFSRFHAEKRADMSLCLTEVADVSRYGAVTLDRSGRIIEFQEKGARAGAGAINAGVYLVSRRLIEAMAPATAVSLEKDVIPAQIGASLYGFTTKGKFIDIGIPSDYEAVQHFFTTASARQAGNACLDGLGQGA
jgi:NDP-sugar pyrophosphorylase family protein